MPAPIQLYADGPAQLRSVLQGLPEHILDASPPSAQAGKWTIRQVVCHLADSEVVYADRMKRVLAEDHPTVFDADPDLLVPALAGVHREIEDEIRIVEVIRKHMLPILERANQTDWQRSCQHSTDGSLSLADLLDRANGHIPHHLGFIESKIKQLSM